MPRSGETLSVNEVAAVVGMSPRAVNEIVDEAILPARFVVRRPRRAFMSPACYLIAVYHGTSGRLTKPVSVRMVNLLSEAFGPLDAAAGRWQMPVPAHFLLREAFLTLDVRPFFEEVGRGGLRLDEARAMVTEDPDILGGMPVIAGTRIPVHDVAASARKNIPAERILRAYPALSPRHIELAQVYADAHPPRGRPARVNTDWPDARRRSGSDVLRKAS